jgi:uncharacterized caspase-like protein
LTLTRHRRLLTPHPTGLVLDEIEAQIQGTGGRVVLLDACNAGADDQRALADPEFARHVYEQARGFALIAASTAQQQAHEQPGLGHGLFTHFILEGLAGAADRNSKGFVTANDLSAHVLDALRRWSVTTGGALQEPTARTETRETAHARAGAAPLIGSSDYARPCCATCYVSTSASSSAGAALP